MATELVEHLSGPETGHDVRHRPKAMAKSDPLRHSSSEVLPLGVVAAERLLGVRETRPILDMEKRSVRRRPSHQICPAGELIVLVRLVERHGKAVRRQPTGEELAHRRMHRILGPDVGRAPSRINEARIEAKSEGKRNTNVAFQARRVTALEPLHEGLRHAGTSGDVPERPTAPVPLLAGLEAQLTCQQGQGAIDLGVCRHSDAIGQDEPYRPISAGLHASCPTQLVAGVLGAAAPVSSSNDVGNLFRQ